MKHKLVIDVTQLVNWKGKLTGIPRVMDELSRRFADSDTVAFVCFDGGNFRFIDRTVITERSKVLAQAQPVAAVESSPSNPKKQQALLMAKRLYKKSPLLQKAYKRIKVQSVAQSGEGEPVWKPLKNQKMLIMWGEWGDASYISAVEAALNAGVELCQFAQDMIPLVVPQFSGHSTVTLQDYAEKIYPRCKVIIAISENTKKDVLDWFKDQGEKPPKVRVTRLGDFWELVEPQKPQLEARIMKLLTQPFIISVGTLEARKNHTILYYTYKLAKARSVTLPPLFILGRRGWMTDEVHEFITKDPEINQHITFLEDRSDGEIAWFYAHCTFSIYQSFYEGWGLPIAESLAHGAPVIASNTSSMPEVAGDLVTYFNPASTDECLEAITTMMQPKTLARAKKKAKQYQPTSWDQTYTQVRSIMELDT